MTTNAPTNHGPIRKVIFDTAALQDSFHAGVKRVIVHDLDTGGVYRTALAAVIEHARPWLRGDADRQVEVDIGIFECDDPTVAAGKAGHS